MLAWVDIESTGLSPIKDLILEVAVIITDDQLKIVDELEVVLTAYPEDRDRANQFVQGMHDKSGLWHACYKSMVSEEQAQKILCDFMDKHFKVGDVQSPLCGSSVHFDRSFLAADMPEFLSKFTYRNLDVSSFKEFIKRATPELARESPDGEKPHRALADIDASIREMRYYRDTFFTPKIGKA